MPSPTMQPNPASGHPVGMLEAAAAPLPLSAPSPQTGLEPLPVVTRQAAGLVLRRASERSHAPTVRKAGCAVGRT